MGNSPGTGQFPAQMASNAENVSIWWRHHDVQNYVMVKLIELGGEIWISSKKSLGPRNIDEDDLIKPYRWNRNIPSEQDW